MIARDSGLFSLYDARIGTVAAALLCLTLSSCDTAPLLAPTNSRISLVSGSRVVPLNGSTTLEATVLENSGSPVPNGTTVRFTSNLGRVDPAEATTRNGVATTTFHAGTESGVARVQAVSGLAAGAEGSGEDAVAGNVVEINVGAAAAGRITLSANPSTVRTSGSTIEVSAVVSDTGGNPVPGVPVTFSTSRGSINPTIATTDANGQARTSLTSNEAATITATVGAGGDGQTAEMEVATSLTPSFQLAVEPDNPSAGQPVRLTITPAEGTAPGVTVNWGDSADTQDIGVVAAERSVTHTYSAPGFFTISAVGTQGNDTFTNSTAVTVAQQPGVELTVNPSSGPVGTTFTFTITPTIGALIQNVTINFGDGTSQDFGPLSTERTVTHQYGAPAGTKTATVTQIEVGGRQTQSSVTVSVF